MDDFDKVARAHRSLGLVPELLHFLATTKKWWLLPVIVVLFMFGLLIFLSGTAAAPFIYTLF